MRVGSTTSGNPVFDVFPLVDTHGIPLSVVLSFFHQHDFAVAWGRFLDQAARAGWNIKRKLPEFYSAVMDEFGYDYAHEWQIRAKLYLG